MGKSDYKTVAGKVSDLYYASILIEGLLRWDMMTDHDRTFDEYGRVMSHTASRVSWCWFQDRKREAVTASGWSSEEFQEAEDEAERLFYDELENCPAEPVRVPELVHDYGDEDEASLDFFESLFTDDMMN